MHRYVLLVTTQCMVMTSDSGAIVAIVHALSYGHLTELTERVDGWKQQASEAGRHLQHTERCTQTLATASIWIKVKWSIFLFQISACRILS